MLRVLSLRCCFLPLALLSWLVVQWLWHLSYDWRSQVQSQPLHCRLWPWAGFSHTLHTVAKQYNLVGWRRSKRAHRATQWSCVYFLALSAGVWLSAIESEISAALSIVHWLSLSLNLPDACACWCDYVHLMTIFHNNIVFMWTCVLVCILNTVVCHCFRYNVDDWLLSLFSYAFKMPLIVCGSRCLKIVGIEGRLFVLKVIQVERAGQWDETEASVTQSKQQSTGHAEVTLKVTRTQVKVTRSKVKVVRPEVKVSRSQVKVARPRSPKQRLQKPWWLDALQRWQSVVNRTEGALAYD